MKKTDYEIDPKYVALIGRCHKEENKKAYGFHYSAAGIEFFFEGTSLSVYLSASEYKTGYESYVAVYIDDEEPIALCIEKEGWQEVASAMANHTHIVKILKRSEANVGVVYIHSIRLSEGGHLFPAPAPIASRKIQVLGDSIACGYGNLWTEGKEIDFPTRWEDGTNTYATMTAKRFGAALEVISISGIGAGNEERSPWPILPAYRETDPTFDTYIPELVIIELGTNDASMKNPAASFIKYAVELIQFVRGKYPNSTIFWTYGIMGDSAYTDIVKSAVDTAVSEKIDHLYFIPVKACATDCVGLAGHPAMEGHQHLAEILSEQIVNLLGWERLN